jgi:muramoyltetrapeptide carboxypeptidase
MVTPPYLRPGDKAGVVSTARKVSRAELAPVLDLLRSWQLQPVEGQNLYREHHQFAGTDEERAADLQSMLDNPEIKAVIFARGGYGTLRIIDRLDFSTFLRQPKWLAGYSDITVLHSHLHNAGVETIHSVMLSGFPADGSTDSAVASLRAALYGEKIHYETPTLRPDLQRPGTAEGQLVGGNLSLLYALSGSASDISTEGKILFIEDLDEYLYHVDRMMLNLKRSGKLEKLKGLVVGGMSEMKDNPVPFGKTAEEIIADAVSGYSYPVCYGFPAGHITDNRALILGRKVSLRVEPGTQSLVFSNGGA